MRRLESDQDKNEVAMIWVSVLIVSFAIIAHGITKGVEQIFVKRSFVQGPIEEVPCENPEASRCWRSKVEWK